MEHAARRPAVVVDDPRGDDGRGAVGLPTQSRAKQQRFLVVTRIELGLDVVSVGVEVVDTWINRMRVETLLREEL